MQAVRGRALIVRRFMPGDFSSVLELEQESFQDHNPFLYTEFYESNPDGFLVAELDGRVVGFAVGLITPEKEGWVFTLSVKSDFRRRGIGGMLLGALIELFRHMTISRVKLEVRVSNIAAQRLYSRFDFVASHLVPGYYADAEDAIVMVKTLLPGPAI